MISDDVLEQIEAEANHQHGRSATMAIGVGWVKDMLAEIRAGRGVLGRNGHGAPHQPAGPKPIMLSACRYCFGAPNVREWENSIFIECLHLDGKAGTCVGGQTLARAADNWNLMQR